MMLNGPDLKYRCKICGPGRASVNKYSVIRHLRKHHPLVTNFENYIVEFDPSKKQMSTLSVKTALETGNAVMGEGGAMGFHCTICPFFTLKKGRLRAHMDNHKPRPENKFKCRHCPYFVVNPRLLHSHIRLHLQEQGLIPRDTPIVTSPGGSNLYPQKQDVNSQVQSTGTSVPAKNGKICYSCNTCPFFTFTKNDYLYHKQFHRPKAAAQYKCELCPYWIKEKRLLGLHMKVSVFIMDSLRK